MNLRSVSAVVFLLAVAPAYSSEKEAAPPGMMSRIFKPWTNFTPREPATKASSANWKQLNLTMSVAPLPLKLPETRQLKVTLSLANRGKKLVQLEFPTTQRIEVLLRNADGKMIEQWSEDQSFSAEQTLVAINPNERLEYTVSVATRDMVPGQRYTVEGFFPNYEILKNTRVIVPEK